MSVRVTVYGVSTPSGTRPSCALALMLGLLTLQELRGRIVFRKRYKKGETHWEILQEETGANRTVHDDNFLRLSAETHFFQCSSFLADGHNGPDEDLEATGGTNAHADRFPPTWIHVWPIVERCVVHLHEDVGQDELEREGRVTEWAGERAIRTESCNRRTREAETRTEKV